MSRPAYESKMSEQVGSYEVDLHCNNCGEVQLYMLDKGMRVTSTDCDNCGVKMLKRVDYYTRKDIEERELE